MERIITKGRTISLDLEANGLNPDKIWIITCVDVACPDGDAYVFRHTDNFKGFKELHDQVDTWVIHNGLGYDHWVIKKLLPPELHLPQDKIVDTLILSRMLRFNAEMGHSLEAWGIRLGSSKGKFNGPWDEFTEEMVPYGIQDARLCAKIYNWIKPKLLKPEYMKAIEVEHKMACVCWEMKQRGFAFDYAKALEVYQDVSSRLAKVDQEVLQAFPPKPKPDRVVIPKAKKDGTLSTVGLRSLVEDGMDLSWFSPDSPFTVFTWEEFNPGSPKQVVQRLNEAGWKPTEKTKGHIDAERAKDKEAVARFKKEGWKVSEENLKTLPDNAPPGAKKLVERIIYASRKRTLEEWFQAYNHSDGRIHATFNSLGAWTHRMSHKEPNLGNIAAEKSLKYNGEYLAGIVKEFGKTMRSLWCVAPNNWQVGTDAEGIQLRILAHYINDPDFTHAIVAGKKEDGTDIHTLNQKALGYCKTRDNAKQFIYSWLLGAQAGKVSSILDCSIKQAKDAMDNFVESYPGLRKLKYDIIPKDAERKFFIGLDGRPVYCDEERLMLAGYLQNGEACVMKHATIDWLSKVDPKLVWLINFVHDEWQSEVIGTKDFANSIGALQADSIRITGENLKCLCPLSGSYSVGKNWQQTH